MVESLVLTLVLGRCPDGKIGNAGGERLVLDSMPAVYVSWPFGSLSELTTDEEILGYRECFVDAEICKLSVN